MKRILHSVTSVAVLAMSVLFGVNARANICFDVPLQETDSYTYETGIEIKGFDGTPLAANIFVPKAEPSEKGFPTVIFVSSWNLTENQYLYHAKRLAERGYIVLSYATRGFGCSGGMAEVASQNDMNDLSATVDYLYSRNDVDVDNIGVAGVSYGAGIALIGLAKEPRIKTAVSMSGWGSLAESLYGQQSARMFWGNFLTLSGNFTGTVDPEVEQIFDGLLSNENIPYILEWAEERSPSHYVKQLNERQAPVFISHNYGDDLFHVNSILKMFHQLTGPKRIELNQGTHASTEIPGLFGADVDTWENAHKWFDYWLQGKQNMFATAKHVSILTDVEYKQEEYRSLPGFSEGVQWQQWYLNPRQGLFEYGPMSKEPNNTVAATTNAMISGLDSGANTGIPVLSTILDGHFQLPVKLPMSFINPLHGLSFQTPPLQETMSIRGIPTVNLRVSSSSQYLHLVAYMYDVDSWGVGTLITHGPMSRHNLESGRATDVAMELVATAYDIPEGHRLVIVFDTFDILYDVPTLFPYTVDFHFGEDSTPNLTLPTL